MTFDESAMAFRMSTVNRIQFNDLDLYKEFLTKLGRVGKIQKTTEKDT